MLYVMRFGKDVIRFDTTLCDSFNTLCGLGIIECEFEPYMVLILRYVVFVLLYVIQILRSNV